MNNFTFDVDIEHNKKNNELFKDTKRLQTSAGVYGLLQLILAAAALWWSNQAIWGWILVIVLGIMAIISFAMINIIPKKVGTPENIYRQYPLVPAIIAQVNPRDLVLLALVNKNIDPDLSPQWALAARNITRINGHERIEGEEVPSVGVSGRRSLNTKDQWDEITPMPIAWATPSSKVIADAHAAIPQEQWELLKQNKGRLDEVFSSPHNLIDL